MIGKAKCLEKGCGQEIVMKPTKANIKLFGEDRCKELMKKTLKSAIWSHAVSEHGKIAMKQDLGKHEITVV